MKNTDLTTIISGILGVVLIAMATVVLLYEPGNIIFAGSLVAGALGLNGYNAALLAPSPKQGEQIAQAVVAAVPQVPLVNITHNAPSDTQVSSAAQVSQPVSSRPVNIAPPVQQGFMNVPSGQGVPTMMPQGTAVQQSGGWQVQPPLPQSQQPPPYQVDRQWTNLTMPAVPPGVPPTQQQ